MYKVLIVDDEPLIREGISMLIEWEALDTELIGTAGSAEEAEEIINNSVPDVVITDIRLPGKSGIDLVEDLHEIYPGIRFIVISGYSEFEYAHRLMRHGVNHYLLKPSDESEIKSAISDIVSELNADTDQAGVRDKAKSYLAEIAPYIKTNLLKDYILTGVLSKQDLEYFDPDKKLQGYTYRMIAFEPGDNMDLLSKYALKNIAGEIISSNIHLCDFLGNYLLILVSGSDIEEIYDYVSEIREQFRIIFGVKITTVISNEVGFDSLSCEFANLRGYFEYKFYLGEDCIITEDLTNEAYPVPDIDKFVDSIAAIVQSGNIERYEDAVNALVGKIKAAKCEVEKANIYMLRLLIEILMNANSQDAACFSESISKILSMDNLDEMADEIKRIIRQIAKKNHMLIAGKYTRLVKSLITLIHENVANEDFSLVWAAKRKLFVNVDYLGKLFLKETGERFSTYLMRVRMETAKKMIATGDYKMYEIADATGFADNGHYFSICFKKYTGKTPSEYLAQVMRERKANL